jgi:hypothetical protein
MDFKKKPIYKEQIRSTYCSKWRDSIVRAPIYLFHFCIKIYNERVECGNEEVVKWKKQNIYFNVLESHLLESW